jgi:hypothetical protein
MGLKSASAVFCRFLDRIKGDLKWSHVLAYIDDLLIHTPTFDKHIQVLSQLLGRLDAAHLTLRAKKCSFVLLEVRFLGHVVDATGIRPDPAKVLAVEALQLPNSSENLQHVLGLLGYYRKFILNYSSVAEPLRKKLAGPLHSWYIVDGTVP